MIPRPVSVQVPVDFSLVILHLQFTKRFFQFHANERDPNGAVRAMKGAERAPTRGTSINMLSGRHQLLRWRVQNALATHEGARK